MAKKAETPTPDRKQSSETEKPAEERVTIGSVVEQLVLNAELSYEQIVDMIRDQFPHASTSRRSVASVAARLRKKGATVPMRRAVKAE